MFEADHLITALSRERTARRKAEERVEKLRAALEEVFDLSRNIGTARPSSQMALRSLQGVARVALREVPAS